MNIFPTIPFMLNIVCAGIEMGESTFGMEYGLWSYFSMPLLLTPVWLYSTAPTHLVHLEERKPMYVVYVI